MDRRKSLASEMHAMGGETRSTFLVESQSESVFDMIDKDGDGVINREEFKVLHDTIRTTIKADLEREHEEHRKASHAKRRARVLGCALSVLCTILAISIASNFGVVFYVVSSFVTTGSSPARDGALMDTVTGGEAQVVQSGVEVPLGMLPHIAVRAPMEAVAVAPEFVVIATNRRTVAYRISNIAFEAPAILTLYAFDGSRIVLNAMQLTGVITYPDNTDYTFCAACSMVQLRSLHVSSASIVQARQSFQRLASNPDANARDICGSQGQVGRLIAGLYNSSDFGASRIDPLPEVCTASDEDSSAVSSRGLQASSNHNAVFDAIDTNGNGKLNVVEVRNAGAIIQNQLPPGAADWSADILGAICACCYFHTYASMYSPSVQMTFVEFSAMMANLDMLYSEFQGTDLSAYSSFLDEEADESSGTCTLAGKGKGKGNGRRLAEDGLAEDGLALITGTHSQLRRQLDHAPGCPETGDGCHPASATLRTQKGQIRIDDVAIGEMVATPLGFEPVVGKLHADANRAMAFYRFETANGTSVAISRRHQLIVNGERTSPEAVVVGDVLSTESGSEVVTAIVVHKELGVYHITTPSGLYYVDGVLATTYVRYIPYPVWRVFSDGYLHLRYLLGVPLLPDGKGALPLFAHYGALDLLDLPEPLMMALWPLTVAISVAIELVNSLVSVVSSISTSGKLALPATVLSITLVKKYGQKKYS